MPLNEAAGFRKVGLNREQRHAAEAALMGVPMSTEQVTLSHDEAERLRSLLQQHDRQSMPKQFDLNAPPKQHYTFQPFPQMIYDHENRQTKIVNSLAERESWLALGWKEQAFSREVPEEVSLDPDEAAEVAKVDAVLQAKRGPGRPSALKPPQHERREVDAYTQEVNDYLIGAIDAPVKRGPGRPRKVVEAPA